MKVKSNGIARRPSAGWLPALGLAAAICIGLVVVLTADSEPSGEPESPTTATTLPVLVNGGGFFDVDFVSSPQALSGEITRDDRPDTEGALIVQGEIAGYEPGRIDGVGADYPEDPGDQPVIMTVEVNEVLREDSASPTKESTVTVELPGTEPKQTDARLEELRKELPSGAPVVLYLVKPLESEHFVVTPQGFIVDLPEQQGVVDAQLGIRYPDASLQDFEPSENSFPARSKPVEPGESDAVGGAP